MKHVRITLDAGGREGELHPMYGVMTNADFVDRATALQWNYTGDRLGIVHRVHGDIDAFREAVEAIEYNEAYELVDAGDDIFYAFLQDAMTDEIRELFDAVTRDAVVAVPPIEYRSDGTVSYAMLGPNAAVQRAIDDVPAPVDVAIETIGGIEAVPGISETALSDRQVEALEAGLEEGYYDVPRSASHEDVAAAMDCAASTAAEHLRKGEVTLIRTVLG